MSKFAKVINICENSLWLPSERLCVIEYALREPLFFLSIMKASKLLEIAYKYTYFK